MIEKIHYQCNRLRLYLKFFGICKGLWLFFKLWIQKGVLRVQVSTLKKPVYLRGKSSDIKTFEEVILRKSYTIPNYLSYPKVIVDCGANTGLTAVYFANLYPNALIICVEPEASNLLFLEKNIAGYPNIKVVKAGVWNKNTHLIIENPNEENWGFKLKESQNDTGIKAVTLEQILKDFGILKIDILKMDIEGSEYEVFASNYEGWIDTFDLLIIEFHERFRPGVTALVEQRLFLDKWDKIEVSENVIYRRKSSK